MIGETPICVDCAHLHAEIGPLKCDAYPEGIPEAIVFNEHDHRLPYKGDHGILFKLRAGHKEPPPVR